MSHDILENNKPSLTSSIRSYVLRQGRITSAQRVALTQYWPKYGIAFNGQLLNFITIFTRPAPVILEIGFGMGQSLLTQALAMPEYNFLGIEVHQPGIGSLLTQLQAHRITNVRLINHDAVPVIQQSIANQSLAKIQIFFPDPWPKKRHHKRRLMQPAFIELLASKLATGGLLHFATDWQDYAQITSTYLHACPLLQNELQNTFVQRPATKFEQRGKKLGHDVWDFLYQRI